MRLNSLKKLSRLAVIENLAALNTPYNNMMQGTRSVYACFCVAYHLPIMTLVLWKLKFQLMSPGFTEVLVKCILLGG